MKSEWVAKMFYFPSCVITVRVGALMRAHASLDPLTPADDRGRWLPGCSPQNNPPLQGL